SAPAQNARPAPVTITARTVSSASARSKASISSRIIVGVKAFSFSGRLSVIVSTPPSTSYRICSYAIVSPSRPRHAPELEVEVVRRGPVVEGDGVAPRAVRRDELAAHDAPDAAARRLHPVSDR